MSMSQTGLGDAFSGSDSLHIINNTARLYNKMYVIDKKAVNCRKQAILS